MTACKTASSRKKSFDVVVIGAGVVGCAIARELARYRLECAVLEKENDVGRETSSKNSGVVHSGVNNRPGTLMAELCVEGNTSFAELCRQLDVPYRKSGKLIVAKNRRERSYLEGLLKQGRKNRVAGLEIIGPGAMKRLEPNVRGECALHSPETAVTSPYKLTIALAENALANGVKFFPGAEVTGIESTRSGFQLNTGRGRFQASYVINSAGLRADKIARMAGIDRYRIYPCRGEYHILDKRLAHIIDRPVYPVPRKESGGLGVHLTPSVEGNILLGPSAEYVPSKTDASTTRSTMDLIARESQDFLSLIRPADIIRSYAGVRPKLTPPDVGGYADFIVEAAERHPNFISLVGIESPGFTAAVPLARRAVGIIDRRENLKRDPEFTPTRQAPVRFAEQNPQAKKRLIAEDPDYGQIVCRCEEVTRREVLQAIHSPLAGADLASIKYRTRALMGRCQGGYCMTRLIELLRSELSLAPREITLRGSGSEMLAGYRSPPSGLAEREEAWGAAGGCSP